jgi:hypothetical protein
MTHTISTRAEPATPKVQFTLIDRTGAHCPDQLELRTATIARLGYDPFVANAPFAITATISRASRGLRGEVRVDDPSSREGPLTRRLESSTGDCNELGKAMALAISIVIDSQRDAEPAPSSASPPGSARAGTVAPGGGMSASAGPPGSVSLPAMSEKDGKTTKSSDERDPDAAADTDSDITGGTRISITMGDRYHWQLALGGLATLGPEPEISGGGLVGVGLAGHSYSFELEGRADLPQEAPYGGGTIAVSTALASLIVCGKLTGMALCGLGRTGALHGTGRGYGVDTSGSSFLAMLGMRVSYEGVVSEPVRLRAALDVDWVMTRNSFDVDHRPGWAVSSAAASFGLATVVRFQ